MFRFSHTTAGDNNAVKAVFLDTAETTPTAMHFNVKSGKGPAAKLSLNQIAFKTSVGGVSPDEAEAFVIARAAIAQHKRYQDHVATVGLPQETVTA